ncbi:FMN-dependent NADH-azoreductase [Sphingobium aquiterrae]|uniref:FMN-dependent NADH-azoreductase n=1 Tax=Sphingobium aquiterrae TaxID=2038656 RepID=UPI003017D2E8
MKLLHIDSAITQPGSVTRKLSADIVKRLVGSRDDVEVIRRDLAADPLDHFTLGDIPAPDGMTEILEEFLGADVIVIGAPMYNFTVSSQLKAWIDRILIAGKTFTYGAEGPVGLAGGKRVIIAVARGGFYGVGTPAAANEHLQSYLAGVFAFIGITPEFVVAEGVMIGADHREAALADAERHILTLGTI